MHDLLCAKKMKKRGEQKPEGDEGDKEGEDEGDKEGDDIEEPPAGEDGKEREYSKWSIINDESIDAFDRMTLAEQRRKEGKGPSGKGEKKWEFTGVEITSPIFLFADISQNLARTAQLLETLHANFDVSANKSCGLHVHTGNASSSFPLHTIKNLCVLTTVFERLFNSLHPLHRMKNGFCRPPLRAWHQTPPAEICGKIEGLEDIDEVVDRCCGVRGEKTRYQAMNLCNLDHGEPEDDAKRKRTVEWRQHAGCVDAGEIGWWASVCCEVVGYCHSRGKEGVFDVVDGGLYGGGFKIGDLLKVVGIEEGLGSRRMYEHPWMKWEWRDPLTVRRANTVC